VNTIIILYTPEFTRIDKPATKGKDKREEKEKKKNGSRKQNLLFGVPNVCSATLAFCSASCCFAHLLASKTTRKKD